MKEVFLFSKNDYLDKKGNTYKEILGYLPEEDVRKQDKKNYKVQDA